MMDKVDFIHNIPSSKLNDLTFGEEMIILARFYKVGEWLNINPDAIFKVDIHEETNFNDLLSMSSVITIYNNINHIFLQDSEDVNRWFRRANENAPFNNTNPLEHMQKGLRSILEVRFYTNALRYAFDHDLKME